MRLRHGNAVLASLTNGATGALRRVALGRPGPLLAFLAAVQVAIALAYAYHVPHNGWLWYSGGDATEYWTAQWSLAHGVLLQTLIGYGLAVLYAWVPLVAGPTLLQGLPVIVLVQVGVLLPLSIVLVWAVANRLFGRFFALWTTCVWIIGPPLFTWGLEGGYRQEFERTFLVPHWYGFTNMADFPSLVLVLACTWAALRTASSARISDGVLTGLLAGLLVGLKPGNGFFLIPLAVLLAAKRSRIAVAAALAATVPALVTLALWKYRGLGYLPATNAYASIREAAAPEPGNLVAVGAQSRYLPIDIGHLQQELRDLGDRFWSLRLLEFLALGGLLGACRRDLRKGIFLGLWFVLFCLVKGMTSQASITDVAYFRLTEPGLAAFIFLTAACCFLVPRLGRRAVSHLEVETNVLKPGVIAATAVVTAVVPLTLIAAVRTPSEPRQAKAAVRQTEMPIDPSLRATARAEGSAIRLSWPSRSTSAARVQYVVLAVRGGADGCTIPTSGAAECILYHVRIVDVSRQPTALVARRKATYRIGVAANDTDEPNGGDLVLLGPALRVG